MRLPYRTTSENQPESEIAEPSRVSIPDRRRIDSDVRAFLREPSTPWIVFDRDPNAAPSPMREMLPPPRVSVLSMPHFFPAAAASTATANEPSSLAVAADLLPPPPDEVRAELPSLPAPSRRHLALKIGAVATGALSVFAIAAFAMIGSGYSSDLQNTRTSGAIAAMPAEVTPPDLDPKFPTQATEATPPSAPAPAAPKVDDPKMRFARLTIATNRDVFLDGKRLLGRGARSFVVVCGPHTISVGTREGGQPTDVPCNAELVISR